MTDKTTDNTGVVFILLNESEEMLLQLRDSKDTAFPNKWCFPGGRKDKEDNSYIEALLRESEEEYSIALKSKDCILIDTYTIDGFVNDNHVYVCNFTKKEPITMNEGAGMQWMNIEEIMKMDLGFKQAVFLPKLIDFLKGRRKS